MEKQLKIRFLLCFIVLLQFTLGLTAQNAMQNELKNYCDKKEFEHTNIGISVRDMSSNNVIAEVNGNKSMTPASIVKIYTSAAALHNLCDTFRFKTTLGYTGSIDKNGVLNGNIVIIGGGDPTTGSKYFPQTKAFIDTILQTVINAGITQIKGRVIIDCSLYKDEKESIPSTWLFDDFGKDYAAGIFPVSFQDNIFQMSIKTGNKGDTANFAKTNLEHSDFSLDAKTGDSAIFIHSNSTNQLIKVEGYIPPNRNEYVVRSAMPSPPDVLGMELHQAFFKKGLIQFNHDYKISKKSVPVEVLKEIYSPRLDLIVAIMNYYSSNNYAEHIVKYLAYSQNHNATFAEGAMVVMDYFKTLKIKSNGVSLFDGSGLSRTDIINANHMSEFLVREFDAAGGVNSSFYRSLPVSGKNGTLRSFPFSSVLINKIHAKTGSMSGVRNMAGYMETKSGKTVSFCIMFNGFFDTDYEMEERQVKMLEMIYNNY